MTLGDNETVDNEFFLRTLIKRARSAPAPPAPTLTSRFTPLALSGI